MSTPKPSRADQNAKKCRYEQAKDNKRSFENGRVLEGENGRKQRQHGEKRSI